MMHALLLGILTRVRSGKNPGPLKKTIGSWLLRTLPGFLTCREFEDFIHDYYEESLSASIRRQFDEHLQLCPMCRIHFEDYVRTIALGKAVCENDEDLPTGMPEELVGAILLAQQRDRRT